MCMKKTMNIIATKKALFRFCFHTPKSWSENDRPPQPDSIPSFQPRGRCFPHDSDGSDMCWKLGSRCFCLFFWFGMLLTIRSRCFFFLGMLLTIHTIHVQILIHWRLFKFVSYHWMLLNVTDSNSPVTMTMKQVSFRFILLESCTKQKPGYQCQPFPCRLGEIPRRLLFCLSREARQCSGMSIWTGAAGATGWAAVGHGYVRVCPGMYMLTLSKEV